MSIQSIASSGSLFAAAKAARPEPPQDGGGFAKALSGVAEKLGMSTEDLKSALKSGSTLDDLASEKGVSQSDLISTLKEGLKANKPDDAPELDDTQLTQMATDIAAGKGPGGPGGPGGPRAGGGGLPRPGESGSDTDSNLSSLTEALGLDSSSLMSAIQNGTSLATLLGSSSSSYGSSSSSAYTHGGLAVDTYA